MLTFDIAGAQIDGARDYQEDAFLVTHIGDVGDSSMCVVADGMGGHAAGNVASNMAVQTFNKHITSHYPSDNLSDTLRDAVLQANNSITETVKETAALKGMGCTLVAAVLAGDSLRWVSVGDSHLYLVRDGKLTKKNADHSYGGFLDRMAAEGTPVEPEAGFSRNMLMSALTGDDIADIDCPRTALDLKAGDKVIIATDGLDSLSAGKITAFATDASSSKACVDKLLAAVENAGMPRQDNTTVIVVSVTEKPSAVAGEDVMTEPATGPAVQTSHGFEIEHVPEEPEVRGKTGLIVAAVFAHLLVGGAAVWWFLQPKTEPEPAVVETPVDEPAEPAETAGEQAAEPEAEPIEPEVTIGAIAESMPREAFRDSLGGGAEGPLMIAIPRGSYMMGSPASTAKFDQRPQHRVNVPPFAMGVYEVTVAEYNRYAAASGRPRARSNLSDASTAPVTFVSWNDSLNYTKWLSKQTGKSYRLPSEAEWEYAARAGTTSNYWWGRRLGSGNAHCIACDTGLDPRNPTRVGRFKPNPFGLYDTAGNVSEWVYDCHHKDYQGAPGDGSVWEGGDCNYRIARGGAFGGGDNSLRSAYRDRFKSDTGNDSVGFRVARDP